MLVRACNAIAWRRSGLAREGVSKNAARLTDLFAGKPAPTEEGRWSEQVEREIPHQAELVIAAVDLPAAGAVVVDDGAQHRILEPPGLHHIGQHQAVFVVLGAVQAAHVVAAVAAIAIAVVVRAIDAPALACHRLALSPGTP